MRAAASEEAPGSIARPRVPTDWLRVVVEQFQQLYGKKAAALYTQAGDYQKTARFYYKKAEDTYYQVRAPSCACLCDVASLDLETSESDGTNCRRTITAWGARNGQRQRQGLLAGPECTAFSGSVPQERYKRAEMLKVQRLGSALSLVTRGILNLEPGSGKEVMRHFMWSGLLFFRPAGHNRTWSGAPSLFSCARC